VQPQFALGLALFTVASGACALAPSASELEHTLLGHPHVIGVGGDGASLIDFDHAVYGDFPLMLAVIGVATFLLLARAFRSVLLAAKAVVFNLISLAAAYGVLMLGFLSMSTGPQTDLKVPATGLGAGILIDAVVVRCLLVPALVALFGRANWWLPAWLARVLRVPAREPVPPTGALGVAGQDELVLTGR
jgi:uncharacterized membrane protein YdfJ with MMPL/SSD domain